MRGRSAPGPTHQLSENQVVFVRDEAVLVEVGLDSGKGLFFRFTVFPPMIGEFLSGNAIPFGAYLFKLHPSASLLTYFR